MQLIKALAGQINGKLSFDFGSGTKISVTFSTENKYNDIVQPGVMRT